VFQYGLDIGPLLARESKVIRKAFDYRLATPAGFLAIRRLLRLPRCRFTPQEVHAIGCDARSRSGHEHESEQN